MDSMRMTSKAITALSVVMFSTAFARSDFTFDVTVDVNNLAPEVLGIAVQCTVYGQELHTGSGAGATKIAVGQASRMLPRTQRSFKGTITVVAKSTPTPQADNTATEYSCGLGLIDAQQTTGGAAANAGAFIPPNSSSYPWTQPEPGAPYVVVLNGKVPRASAPAASGAVGIQR